MNTSTQSHDKRAPEVSDETADALKLFVVLHRAQTAIDVAIATDIDRYGLTGTEFGVMEALYHRGPQLLNEVQRRILVSSGGITFLVDRLEKKGLVERRECETDRRARFAALTTEGEKLMKRIFPEHAERLAKVMSGLTRAETQQAIRLLKKIGLAAAAKAPTD